MSHDPADTTSVRHAIEAILDDLQRAATEFPGPFLADRGPLTVEQLPAQGAGLSTVLAELRGAIGGGIRLNAPGMTGWITVGGTTAAIATQTAVAVAGGQRYLDHAFNHLEHLALRWLADLCGIPTEATGVFTSGGSTANLLSLGAARQAAYERIGVDAAAGGLIGVPAGRIYASTFAHRTIHRSAAVLGLGRDSVVPIPVDGHHRLRADALAEQIDADIAAGLIPVAAVAVAGTTDLGIVDPIAEIVEAARARGCWVHVDGAYGLVAHASADLRHLFDGAERADSWIVDPHKWLSTGVGVGAAYVRDGALLTRTFTEGPAPYLDDIVAGTRAVVSQFDSMSGDWADQSVELSAPPRGPMVWAVLREIGRAGVATRVEHHVGLAHALADRVREHRRLELITPPELSIVTFRYRPADFGAANPAAHDSLTAELVTRLRRTTRFVPSTTVVDGRLVIRPCFINPRQSIADVDGLVDAVVRIGDELAAENVTV